MGRQPGPRGQANEGFPGSFVLEDIERSQGFSQTSERKRRSARLLPNDHPVYDQIEHRGEAGIRGNEKCQGRSDDSEVNGNYLSSANEKRSADWFPPEGRGPPEPPEVPATPVRSRGKVLHRRSGSHRVSMAK